jgi:signal transduction histidine kinase
VERRRYERRADERERLLLADQLITAEQEERRRLALFLHDGPVQSLAGIALMLDAVVHALEDGRVDDAKDVLGGILARQRETIRSLRDLSFNLEPVVLRDQGFIPAAQALAEQVATTNGVEIDLDVDAVEGIAEVAEVVLYQVLREALNQALQRGSPTRISVKVMRTDDEGLVALIEDDGAGERRRGGVQMLQERARTLDGEVDSEPRAGGGTTVRVELPPHAVRR